MHKQNGRSRLAIALGTAMTMFGTTAALAQDASEGRQQAGDQNALTLDTVLVTAQKKVENVQEVPISISVFGAAMLEDAGVDRIEDFIGHAPNVYINFNDSIRATAISVRGVLSDPNNVGIDPSVGVYVDGVYMARPTTINTALYDLERVEVLRGPQGTIFGKNTIGGAMSFVSRLPTDQPELQFGIDYGNFNAATVTLIGNTPKVGERVALRGAVQYQRRDGLLENLAGPDNNDVNNINARVSALVDVGDNVNLVFRVDAARDRTHAGANEILVPSPLFAGPPFNSPHDVDPWDRVIKDSPSAFQDRDLWGASAELNWQAATGTLTAITAYRTFDWNNFQSSDKTEFDLFGTGIKEDQSQFSQEIRFSGQAGERVGYLAGVYYDRQEMDAEAWALVGTDIFALFGLPLGSNPTPGIGYIDIGLKSDSFAGFGQIEVQASERLKLIGGLRYTREDKSIRHQLFADPTGLFVPNTPLVTASRRDNEATWMGSATWSFSDDVIGYLTYAHGFKAGGYNAFSFSLLQSDGSLAEFDPEYVDNFEIGLKSTLLDGRLRLNASLFYMDYEDMQVNQLIPNAQGIIDFQTSNAAKAISKGVELEIAAKLSENFDATLGYGYTDASYDSFVGATPAGDDYSGNVLAQSPKHSFATSLQYRRPLTDNWNLMARGEYVYRSERYSDAANSQAIIGDSYGLVNVRFGFEQATGGSSITFWVRNLFDENYAIARGFGSSAFAPGAIGQSVGNERMYGLEYRYRWYGR